MKTNIQGLMAIIAEEEKKMKNLSLSIFTKIYTTKIQELDGTVNIMEDTEKEFQSDLEDYRLITKKVIKLKQVLYQKNNEYKLSDGRTIQEAIVENTNLRKQKELLDGIMKHKSIKKRCTEVNNSYFECKNINYDNQLLQEESNSLEVKIQETDFEISKLNSIEFEISF